MVELHLVHFRDVDEILFEELPNDTKV